MKKEQLQNIKKFLENSIASYLKISQDTQNLDRLNNQDYITYFEEEETINFPVYLSLAVENDLNDLIQKLKRQLTQINEAIFSIDCLELPAQLENIDYSYDPLY